jgi:hypothetical protein
MSASDVKGHKKPLWCIDDMEYKDTIVLEDKDGNEVMIWMNIKGLWTFI